MAKIKIPFNGTDYSIDESALASAKDSLKTHLSTVMNGSGGGGEESANVYVCDGTTASILEDFVESTDFAQNGYIRGVYQIVDALPEMEGDVADLENRTVPVYVVRATGEPFVYMTAFGGWVSETEMATQMFVDSGYSHMASYTFNGLVSTTDEMTEPGYYTLITSGGSSTSGNTTITLDGVSYSVDPTKLSTVTDGFVAHIGTLAGGEGGEVEIGMGKTVTFKRAMPPDEALVGGSNKGFTDFYSVDRVSSLVINVTNTGYEVLVELYNESLDARLPAYVYVSEGMATAGGDPMLQITDAGWHKVDITTDTITPCDPPTITIPDHGVTDDQLELMTVVGNHFFEAPSAGGNTIITINGAEYLVDSTKLSDAIADLHEALERLSGGTV